MWLGHVSNDVHNILLSKLWDHLGLLKLSLSYQTAQKLQKLCIFVKRTYLRLNLCHLISSAPMHTRVHYIPAVSMGDCWNTKIFAIAQFQRIFSQFARKFPSLIKKNKTYLQKFYTKCFYTLLPTVSVISANVLIIRL